MAKVFLRWLDKGYEESFCHGLQFLDLARAIKPSDKIVIKPNLTYPTFRKGVMTHPSAVEALVKLLRQFTPRITVCESDSGGYNPFSMDEVFEVTGLAAMAVRYDVSLANLSGAPSRLIPVRTGFRTLKVPVPISVLDDTDWFFTMPVPKMHLNTRVSLAIKNQWGVIPQPATRLKLHPYFADVINAITRVLPRSIAVMDGQFGLTRTGPMRGEVVDLGWTLMSDDLYACDYFALKLMSLDYGEVGYLKQAFRRIGVKALEASTLNCEWQTFRKGRFFLKREWTDYPGLLAFKSRAFAYLGYESLLSKPLHRMLYRYREPFY